MPVTRGQIQAALQPLRPDMAETILDTKLTRIERVPCPGLRRYEVFAVTRLDPYKPVLNYIGFAAGEPAFSLSQDPEAFVAMAKADGASIDSAEVAAGYAEALVTVTRPLTKLAYVVKSFADLRFRPKLSAAEEQAKADARAEFGGRITAPEAGPEGKGYRVVIYFVIEAELRRLAISVARDGAVDAASETLGTGLPLVGGV